MNKHINKLLQIQEMELALSTSKVIHKNKDTEEARKKLKSDILAMKEALPGNIKNEIDRISSKYDLYVVPMINDACTGCFIKLPVGTANNIKSPNECIFCPNCHRYLYDEEKPFKRPDDNSRYKGIAKFSSIDLMIPALKSKTHSDSIEEVGNYMSKTGFIKCGKEFAQALLKREKLSSTSVGSGIAFPHTREIQSCGLTLAVALAPEGIDFGDNEMAKILFVSAVPIQTSVFYMQLVSKIVRYFSKEENVAKLLACKTSEEMWKIIVTIGK